MLLATMVVSIFPGRRALLILLAINVMFALIIHYARRAELAAEAVREVNAKLMATRSLLGETARDQERLRLRRAQPDRLPAAGAGSMSLRIALADDQALVLSDIRMPGVDGFELPRRLAEIPPDLPVILLTTFDEAELTLKAAEAGARGIPAQGCLTRRTRRRHSPGGRRLFQPRNRQ